MWHNWNGLLCAPTRAASIGKQRAGASARRRASRCQYPSAASRPKRFCAQGARDMCAARVAGREVRALAQRKAAPGCPRAVARGWYLHIKTLAALALPCLTLLEARASSGLWFRHLWRLHARRSRLPPSQHMMSAQINVIRSACHSHSPIRLHVDAGRRSVVETYMMV